MSEASVPAPVASDGSRPKPEFDPNHPNHLKFNGQHYVRDDAYEDLLDRVAELEAAVAALLKAGNDMALWLNVDSPPVRQWYAVERPAESTPEASDG